jgi:hypothetical protein
MEKPFDEILGDLELQARQAAETRNIPGDVRRALHSAVDDILEAQSAWAALAEKISAAAFFDPYSED